MAEYYALQAALLFSIAHVFVRRGLVHSNALTGSLISLGTSAAIFWLLAFVMVPWSTLWTPAIGYFAAAGVFAPAIGQTLGYIGMERIGVARASPIVNTSPLRLNRRSRSPGNRHIDQLAVVRTKSTALPPEGGELALMTSTGAALR